MSSGSLGREISSAYQGSNRLLWGIGALAIATALIVYGAYGDPNPKSSQEAAVPFLVGLALAITIVVFGVLTPRALRASARTSRWGLGFSIAGFLSMAAFWSGVPILLGAAAVLVAKDIRGSSKAAVAAIVVGCLVIIAPVVITVAANVF